VQLIEFDGSADDAQHPAIGGPQRGDQCGADESRGPGDRDGGGVAGATDSQQVGLEGTLFEAFAHRGEEAAASAPSMRRWS
jgi:hypothetical protein